MLWGGPLDGRTGVRSAAVTSRCDRTPRDTRSREDRGISVLYNRIMSYECIRSDGFGVRATGVVL